MDAIGKKWMGAIPEKCDVCHNEFKDVFIDGATLMGPWGLLCESCHQEVGIGLGIGRGQKYDLKTEMKITG